MKYVGLPKKVARSYVNLGKRRLLKPLPIQFFGFEATRLCNGHCIYCDIWKSSHLVEHEITDQELLDGLDFKLLKDVEEIGVTGGEPFLRKDLADLCLTLKTACPKASIGLVTNGLMPEVVVNKMLEIREIDKNAHIGVSIDGFEYSDGKQRGNPDHYYRAWETAKWLKTEGFHVGIGSVITPINLDEASMFHEFCVEKGFNHSVMTANVSSVFYANDKNEEMESLQIPTDRIDKIDGIMRKKNIFQACMTEYLKHRRQIFPCFSGFNTFFLNSQGWVFPCISRNDSFGSIRVSSLREIWEGSTAQSLRRSIMKVECSCYTMCEVQGWFRANIMPAVKRRIKMKIARG